MNERWSPGIGDPSVMGWFTVAMYVAAMVACATAAWRESDDRGFESWFWGVIAASMLALGINKQLDLQSLLTQIVRDSAKLHGWYEERRRVQEAFILIVAVAGAVFSVVLWRILPLLRRNMRWAAAGMIFVYTYVLIRASSFHHVDLLADRMLFGMRWNWIFEIGGVALILWAALRERGGRRDAGR